MMTSAKRVASLWGESSGTCSCCGRTSRTIWGGLHADGLARATYFVQWTIGAPEHDVHIDLVVGAWGEGTSAADRALIAVLYRPSPEGGSFKGIDGSGRHARQAKLCARSLPRAEVLGTPIAEEVFGFLDAIWLGDPRIAEVTALNNLV